MVEQLSGRNSQNYFGRVGLTPEQRDTKHPEPRRINPPRPISRDILSGDLASDPEIIYKDGKFEISRNGRTLYVNILNHGTFLDASTYLRQTASAPRERGLTTHLYSKALEIFKSATNKRDVGLHYELTTSIDKMKMWALSEKGGRGIFHWDQVWDIHPVEWMFIKTIEPETY